MTIFLVILALLLSLALVFYGLYRFVKWEISHDNLRAVDQQAGREAAISEENEKLEAAQAWLSATESLYHRRVVARDVLGEPLDDHTLLALQENVDRAKLAIQEREARINKLKQDDYQDAL